MEITHIIGYAGAVFSGLILGILGGGAALLAMPILVYLFKVAPDLATGYSFFLIAFSASSGAVQNIRKNQVDYNAALYYGIPSVITMFVTRSYILPKLPATIFTLGSYQLSKNHLILFVLCVVMFAAAYKMIGADSNGAKDEGRKTDHLRLGMFAMLISLFMGLAGAGGGFLVVPALIYFASLSAKKAIGTSLVIVSVNSLVGFASDFLHPHKAFDWKFLFLFTAFATIGVLLGHQFTGHVDNNRLKKYFGWFLFTIAMIMIAKEVFFA